MESLTHGSCRRGARGIVTERFRDRCYGLSLKRATADTLSSTPTAETGGMRAERRNWTRIEVEALVADYLSMLALELSGERYSKAEHRRALKAQLDGRSDGSIEYKHQNTSAVLLELGFPYIEGYKPAWNYQQLLFEVVQDRLGKANELTDAVQSALALPVGAPSIDGVLARLVDRPKDDRPPVRYGAVREQLGNAPTPNYLLMESRNSQLGMAGEQFVLDFERARLSAAGKDRLAANVEHVSQTRGDHEGFDVLSFETDSRERLIEVKTTSFGPMTPFFVSRNQVTRSRVDRERYQVYRVFSFRKNPRLFALPGAIDDNADLEANEFIARLW